MSSKPRDYYRDNFLREERIKEGGEVRVNLKLANLLMFVLVTFWSNNSYKLALHI